MPAKGPFYDQERGGELYSMCKHVTDGTPCVVSFRVSEAVDRNGEALARARTVELCYACAQAAGVDVVPSAPVPFSIAVGSPKPKQE